MPVSIRTALVLPGDFAFADRDRVVIIHSSIAEEVFETAVVLNRSAKIMEEVLIERRGVFGVDITGVTRLFEQEMYKRFNFSDRQLELLRKHVTRIK